MLIFVLLTEYESSSSFVVSMHAMGAGEWAYGVVVSMFDFHRSDRGSNPGRGSNIS